MRAEELPERGHEVPGRQTVQVEQRQHLADLRGLARPRRQDRRAEPHPLARGRVGALVVHPRRGHLHRPGAGQHRPRLGSAVTHHHPPAIPIAQPGELADVRGDLGLQRRGQHLPGAVPHDLVDQRRRLPGRQRASHVRHYCEHGYTFPARRSSAGPLLETSYDSITREGTPSSRTHPPGGSTGFKHCSASGHRCPDSNRDSNSTGQRQTSAVGSTRTLALRMAAWGYVRPEKQTVGDQHRGAATVAKTVAKPLNSTRRTWTTLEYRPSLRPVTDGLGRCAHSYGSEGWGFESLRARPGQNPFPLPEGLFC